MNFLEILQITLTLCLFAPVLYGAWLTVQDAQKRFEVRRDEASK